MKIGVVGTGYVGLVVGAGLAENGNTVVCVDKDAAKIEALKRGVVPIYEPGLAELITRNAAEERLRFTTDLPEAVRASEIIFVAVGTPQDEDGSADMTHVLAVADAIGRAMDGYKVIVNKSTVPVGTAARVRKVIAGLTKHPFAVVSNPEFLKEGAAVGDFLKPDRVVVGADDPQAEALMKELYEPFVRTGNPILTMDPASAELTKYAANAMLATRISFMNEIANLCDQVGADVRQVRLGMGSDERIGSGFLFPGIGYGGSCFPKDVKALMKLAEDAGTTLQVVDAVDRVNQAQKELLVPRIVKHLGALAGKVIAVWGLAFKPRTDDMREAPAVNIIEGLLRQGATVRVYDPKAMEAARPMLGDRVTWCAKSYECVEGADALVLATEWNEFREPDFPRIKSLMRHAAIFDGRNVWSPQTLRDLGFHYEGIGTPLKVAVTGGAGYIGSHAVRELRDSGHDVVVLDDLSAGHRAAVPPDVTLVEGDLGDRAALGRFLEGADAVMHFAGLLSVGQSVSAPGPYYEWNVVKGLALLDAMKAFDVRRFVFSSTCAVYGVPVRVPIDETHPKDPINPYGASKMAFERVLLDHARAGQLKAIALRYFNAAGCHPDGSLGESHDPEEHLVPLAIDAALGRRPALTILGDDYPTPDGTCIRDYIHVMDLARAHVLALEAVSRADAEPFDFFNLGSGTGHSVKQVVETVGRIVGKPVPASVGPRRPGDPPQLVAAPAKAREKLAFATAYGLDAIVEHAYRWRLNRAL